MTRPKYLRLSVVAQTLRRTGRQIAPTAGGCPSRDLGAFDSLRAHLGWARSRGVGFAEKYFNVENSLQPVKETLELAGKQLCARHAAREFWFELLAKLDFYDAKILEHVYATQGGASTLLVLVRQLRQVGIKREALRRRVLMLAELGLLNVACRTKPLCISGRVELEAKVLSLIAGVYQRLGVVRP